MIHFFTLIISTLILIFVLFVKHSRPKLLYTDSSRWSNRLFGHRGCRNKGVTENTLNSFRKAIDKGIEGVEFDVLLTKDNRLVVFHDKTLSRFFNDPKEIRKMSFEELRSLRYPEDSQRITSLEEALDFCQKNNLKVLIEVKNLINGACKAADIITREIKSRGMTERVVVISFSPLPLYKVRLNSDVIETCQLIDEHIVGDNLGKTAERGTLGRLFLRFIDFVVLKLSFSLFPAIIGASWLGPNCKLLSGDKIERIKQRGYSIYTWVVNDRSVMEVYVRNGLFVGSDLID